MIDRDFDAFGLLDPLAGVANDGERLQPEEIHLQQA